MHAYEDSTIEGQDANDVARHRKRAVIAREPLLTRHAGWSAHVLTTKDAYTTDDKDRKVERFVASIASRATMMQDYREGFR